MFAMRTTMSSTSQNSYFRGSSFAGPWSVRERFGDDFDLPFLAMAAALLEPGSGVAWAKSWELRLFAGDRGFAPEVTWSGLLGDRVGSPGSLGVADCDCIYVDAAAVVEGAAAGAAGVAATAAEFAPVAEDEGKASESGGGLAFRTGTVGSNGSIGEY